MAGLDLDSTTQQDASEPLITDVERVEVVAPTALPEGYAVEVTTTGPHGGSVDSTVLVPEGGVSEGERFTADVVPGSHGSSTHYMDIPSDQWRDGIFACFRFGCLHPLFCLGLFCFPIPLGQVMSRMDLNWIGDYRDPETNPSRISAFKVIVFLMMVYLGGLYVQGANLLEEMMEIPLPLFLPMSWWDFCFWVYLFVVVMKTRSYIRRKYSIPERDCTGCEDCFCAFFCMHLSVCQMARHTADYDTYRAAVCTETGLPPNAPTIV